MNPLTAPGIYDGIPDAVYHGQLTDTPSISASGLVTLEQSCPLSFWWHSYLNPARPEEEDSRALVVGSAMHALMLEGAKAFAERYVVRPADMTYQTKAGKEWRDAQTRTIVTAEEYAAIAPMAAEVHRHPMARRAFTGGKPEQTIVWKDVATGIWLKARPDYLRMDGGNVVPNYKTTIDARPETWARQAFNLGYHQAAALLLDGLHAVTGERWSHFWVAQEKSAPFLVQVFVMKDEAIEWGRLLNRRALDTFARCLERGHWPGYGDGVIQVEMPAWAERTLEKRHERGEFSEQQKETAA